MIIDITDNKIEGKDAVERLGKKLSGLTQLRQEEKLFFKIRWFELFTCCLMLFVIKQKGLNHYLAKESQSRLKKSLLN